MDQTCAYNFNHQPVQQVGKNGIHSQTIETGKNWSERNVQERQCIDKSKRVQKLRFSVQNPSLATLMFFAFNSKWRVVQTVEFPSKIHTMKVYRTVKSGHMA